MKKSTLLELSEDLSKVIIDFWIIYVVIKELKIQSKILLITKLIFVKRYSTHFSNKLILHLTSLRNPSLLILRNQILFQLLSEL